jgi:SAM-dependent methyltransferase
MSSSNPKDRFSNRVDAYVRHRPSYPPEVIGYLESLDLCAPRMSVADIGSGTGISAAVFLTYGCSVAGIEPNAAMRQAAERWLAQTLDAGTFSRFKSVDGAAEATQLLSESVDLVIAAQAFHWFDRPAAKTEFQRILRRNGGVALIWNSRVTDSSPFAEGYESLLRAFCPDYMKVRHDEIERREIEAFFAPSTVHSATFPSSQRFDYAGLEGRLLSSSYAPAAGQPRHDEMLATLRRLFDETQTGGAVVMDYRTEVHAGVFPPT